MPGLVLAALAAGYWSATVCMTLLGAALFTAVTTKALRFYAKILKGASGMNGIEDRVTSLLTWGLPLGALAFCASLVLAWFGAPDGFWRGFWEGAAAVLVVAGLAARLWRSFRTREK